MKDFLRAKMSRFTHYFIEFCRDRRYALLMKSILGEGTPKVAYISTWMRLVDGDWTPARQWGWYSGSISKAISKTEDKIVRA